MIFDTTLVLVKHKNYIKKAKTENMHRNKNFIKNYKKTLANCRMLWYYIIRYPGVAQLVARLTGGQEAVSSSLATRTK